MGGQASAIQTLMDESGPPPKEAEGGTEIGGGGGYGNIGKMKKGTEIETETQIETETDIYITETEPLDLSNWRKVVDTIHTAFREGIIVEESTWQVMVLIPKVGGE